MENECKWCNNIFNFEKPKQFGAHLTNCKSNPNKIKRDINSIKKKEFALTCKCGNIFIINETDHNFNIGRYRKFCSRVCSNKRTHSPETRGKISKSLTKEKKITTKVVKIKGTRKKYGETKIQECPNCNKNFEFIGNKVRKFCSRSCATTYRNIHDNLSSNAGKKSVLSQSRRSKNESLFADMCSDKFKILTNDPIFNGWDADIIIPDLKVAILWNGVWHYKKISNKHSLLQVQNRDSIKMSEIIKYGYHPYVIRDDGKFNEEKVKSEFEIFNIWLENRDILIS